MSLIHNVIILAALQASASHPNYAEQVAEQLRLGHATFQMMADAAEGMGNAQEAQCYRALPRQDVTAASAQFVSDLLTLQEQKEVFEFFRANLVKNINNLSFKERVR